MSACKAVFFLCAMAASSIAHAQGIATTFNELRLLVRPGDKLAITTTAGPEVTGRLVDLSAGRLVMRVGDGQQEWREDDVATIRQRRGDSLANGALWGLAWGAGTALVGVISGAAERDGGVGSVELTLIAFSCGFGAGIGTGIDALITKRVVIFERAGSARLHLAPILGHGRRGVALSVGF